MTSTAAPAPAAQSRFKTLLVRVLTIATTVMGLILAVAYVYSLFTLPGCDARRVRDTLTSILRSNGVSTISGYESARETSRTGELVTCARIVNLPNGGRLDLTYRITKQGFGSNQIQASWRSI